MSNENALLFWRIMQYGVAPIIAALIIVISHIKIENIKSIKAKTEETISNVKKDSIPYIQITGNTGNVIINGSNNTQNINNKKENDIKSSSTSKKEKLQKPAKKMEEGNKSNSKKNQDPINIGTVNGDVVISNNQTGGITAHTINYGIPPRKITDDWANQLLLELKKLPVDTFQMHCLMNSSESYELAVRIEKILLSAGWKTSPNGIQRKIFNEPIKNIIVEVNKRSSTSNLLWHWFDLMGFKPIGHETNIGQVIDIIVGENI